RRLNRPEVHLRGCDGCAWASTDQEGERPGRIGRIGAGKVARERLNLLVGLVRLIECRIERGKGFHVPSSTPSASSPESSGSPSKRVASAVASRPCSFSQRASTAL